MTVDELIEALQALKDKGGTNVLYESDDHLHEINYVQIKSTYGDEIVSLSYAQHV